MPQWEYRAIHLSGLPQDKKFDVLNDAGADGWELVGITTNNIAYLKREVAKPGTSFAKRPRCKIDQ
jgi:Domain of unknown function (DUF4177)